MLEYREINVLDRNSEHFGVPTIQLMENAGKAAFEVMKERIELKGKNVCILAGKGNNGGDGVVLARLLAKLSRVTLVLPFPMEQGSELSRENYKRLPKKVKVKVSPAMDELAGLMDGSHVIVDALLGIGITSEPREPIAGIVRTLQRVCEEAEAKALVERKTVVSLDVPTGMGTGLAVTPDLTVTFHDSKTGMNQGNSGDIIISSIGIPELAAIYTGPGDFAYYHGNSPGSHKGQNGIVMVIGGGPYVGAPVLSAMAALRTGADLVHLFVPGSVYMQASSFSPEIIVHPLGKERSQDHLGVESVGELTDFSGKCNSAVIGPGLGRDPDTWKAVGRFINGTDIPLVLDADAIYTIKHRFHIIKGKKAVITPHLGEFRELSDVIGILSDPETFAEIVKRQSREIGATILLKGSRDIITDGKEYRLNDTGHPAMTTGGTGDVLSGIVGALLARGIDPFHSARLGAFISGSAGALAGGEKSFGMIASDVIEKIPSILTKYL